MKSGQTVLLVEDDAVDVMTVERAFDRADIRCRVEVVADGVEALAYLRRTGEYADPSRSPRPSLVLLDLNLPRMAGRELLGEIREDPKLRSLPVIVLTTSSHDRDLQECYDLGVAGYFLKPVGFAEFVEATCRIRDYWSLCHLPEDR